MFKTFLFQSLALRKLYFQWPLGKGRAQRFRRRRPLRCRLEWLRMAWRNCRQGCRGCTRP